MMARQVPSGDVQGRLGAHLSGVGVHWYAYIGIHHGLRGSESLLS